MARLYADGGAKKRTALAAKSLTAPVAVSSGMAVDWLVNENCDTLVIEGHVDLAAATDAMQRESGDFPAPRHAWMRYMGAPEDEPVESGYGWRGECQRGDRYAEPVTISVRNT
ncbi:hypothetical protein ACAX43_26660 [Paraburkholderia sp. IW21]|uniref:hypothetical protein n=1 Tax=Paraburkholderia sp. IW21 TaxID=3242488 RepID=UPI00351FB910